MKIDLTKNKYYIQNVESSSFSNLKNTKQNLESKKTSYQIIQAKEKEKLDNLNGSIKNDGDEIRDGVIVSGSLKKQIEASQLKKDNEDDNTQTSFLVYNRNGLYSSTT